MIGGAPVLMMGGLLIGFLAVGAPAVALAPGQAGVGRAQADFDGLTPLNGWAFFNGEEFPGSSGGLKGGPGSSGRGMVMSFRFDCEGERCGHYVTALWRPDPPITPSRTTRLSWRLKPSPLVVYRVRYEDETGQVFQFPVSEFALGAEKAGGWRRVTAPTMVEGVEHWGGANDGVMHGKIKRVSFVVAPRLPPSQGEVSFDQIELLDLAEHAEFSLSARGRLSPIDVPPPAPEFGVAARANASAKSLERARAAGARFVRVTVPWHEAEKAGKFDLSREVKLMKALKAQGLGAQWVLCCQHPDHGAGGPQSPQNVAAFARFAEAVAARFQAENVAYEIWTEPDGRKLDAATFSALVAAGSAAIARADPDAPIITGGLTWFNRPYLVATAEALDRAGAIGRLAGLGVGVMATGAPETAARDLGEAAQSLKARISNPPPIWPTRWAYSSATKDWAAFGPDGHSAAARRRQGVYAARAALTLWASGVNRGIWARLQDDGPDPRLVDHNSGLLDERGQPKPAHAALAAFSAIAKGRRLAGFAADAPYGAHVLRLEGADGPAYALWTDRSDGSISVHVRTEELLEARDAFGAPLALKADEEGRARLVLREDDGPVYLLSRY